MNFIEVVMDYPSSKKAIGSYSLSIGYTATLFDNKVWLDNEAFEHFEISMDDFEKIARILFDLGYINPESWKE